MRTVRLLSTYRVGERVPINGRYVCVPCGYKMYLSEGDAFPACIRCMRVSRPAEAEAEERGVLKAGFSGEVDEFDEELVAENLELWEFLERSEAPKRNSDADYRK